MADAKPALRLVDRVIAEQPEDTEAKNKALRAILNKHTPAITRMVRADTLREMHAERIAKLEDRPTREEERKHVKAGRWQGRFEGTVVGLIVAVAFVWGYLFVSAAHDRQVMMNGAAIGANTRTMTQPYICEPGQRMPDGHTCGLPSAPPS